MTDPSRSIGCCICAARPAPQRGLELSLRRQHAGRLLLRESDGLLPLCQDCVVHLDRERSRPAWPLLALAAAALLFWRGDWLFALPVLLGGLIGFLWVWGRPGRKTIQDRLLVQALEFSSVPLTGFEPQDLREVVLDRRITVVYPETGEVEVEVRVR